MILVDTSVWIDHLHRIDERLVDALERDEVLTHPFIIGELACGNVAHRDHFLRLLDALSSAPVATHEEAMVFLNARKLMGRGLGYVDLHLLASAAIAQDVFLYTADKKLQRIARELKLVSVS